MNSQTKAMYTLAAIAVVMSFGFAITTIGWYRTEHRKENKAIAPAFFESSSGGIYIDEGYGNDTLKPIKIRR